jgi:hypothetical protein
MEVAGAGQIIEMVFLPHHPHQHINFIGGDPAEWVEVVPVQLMVD